MSAYYTNISAITRSSHSDSENSDTRVYQILTDQTTLCICLPVIRIKITDIFPIIRPLHLLFQTKRYFIQLLCGQPTTFCYLNFTATTSVLLNETDQYSLRQNAEAYDRELWQTQKC